MKGSRASIISRSDILWGCPGSGFRVLSAQRFLMITSLYFLNIILIMSYRVPREN